MKVLIISHNPFSTFINMGSTLASLFNAFRKEEICQFYIYPTTPDLDICNSFYRITDKDVLNSFPFRRVKGSVVLPNPNKHSFFDSDKDMNFFSNKKNQGSFRLLLRDIMWKCSRWDTADFNKWISIEKPDAVFLAAGLSTFIYDLAFKISRKYCIPIVSYICDDYLFSPQKRNPFDLLHFHRLKKRIKKQLNLSKHVVFICDLMKQKYLSKFKINSTTIMTPYSISAKKDNNQVNKNLYFFGNIRLGRYRSLFDIGEALDRINRDFNTDFSLFVYALENDETIIKTLSACKSIKMMGFVSGKEYENIFASSTCVIHCESFEKQYSNLTKYSISTKIPNLLKNGKTIFAYGPNYLASISYLKQNNCAAVCTEKESLYCSLHKILFENNSLLSISATATKIAEKNHSPISNGLILRKRLEEVIKDVDTIK